MITKILLTVLITLPVLGNTQHIKDKQFEIGINSGPVFYLGDLQGNDGIGKPFLKDLNIQNTKTITGLSLTYIPDFNYSRLGYKITTSMGTITAADSLIHDHGGKEIFRKNRNLDFKTLLYELTFQTETYLSLSSLRPYISGGIGLLYFIPQTLHNNKWMDLRPLKTENIDYSQTKIIFPIGLGVKYINHSNSGISIEITYRHTGTDYLDDVSTVYTNNELSFRGYNNRIDYSGKQRGNPNNKDTYFSIVFKYSSFLLNNLKQIKCPIIY